LKAGT
jgi:hypothetical protein